MVSKQRLIDVDYAIDLLGCEDEDIAIKHFLEELPTIDAVEVVHGRWIPIPASTPDGWRDNKTGERVYPMCCSVCGDVYMNGPYKYCPSCGAKMDGDGDA